jgi:hypothetical protein
MATTQTIIARSESLTMNSGAYLDAGVPKVTLVHTCPANMRELCDLFGERLLNFARFCNGRRVSMTMQNLDAFTLESTEVFAFLNKASAVKFASDVGYRLGTRSSQFLIDYNSLATL